MKTDYPKVILTVFITLSICIAHAQIKIVKTESGSVSGLQQGDVSVFKGVPFAAPPVGDLRWKAPQPAASWTGVRACEKFSASPVQSKPAPFNMWTEEFIAPPEPLSEDCLYLNVWTAAKSAKEKRPVFVWIYGGGFISGSSACAIYDGEAMAKEGVVFVSINYRLGAFGFLAHPELTKESGKNASGNYALLDQIAALQWIKKNIAGFGGDPNQVTIAGQSAGSFCVNALVASPLAKGLFHRAIAHSGSFTANGFGKKLEAAEQIGKTFMQNAYANNIAELRAKSADEIFKTAQTLPYGSFNPVFEDYVLPSNPKQYFSEGKHNNVPLMTGWVLGDGSLRGNPGFTAEKYKEDVLQKYAELSDEFLLAFPGSTDEEAKASQIRFSLCQFAAFQSHFWAEHNNSPSYVYEFTFVPTDKPGFPNYGAFHTSEVPYALHTLKQWNRPWQERDYNMEKMMSAYWVNFIKTGNPNGKGLPEWKTHTKQEWNILQLGETVSTQPDLLKKEFTVLEKVYSKK